MTIAIKSTEPVGARVLTSFGPGIVVDRLEEWGLCVVRVP